MLRKTVLLALWITISSLVWGQSASVQYVTDTDGTSFEELSRLALIRNSDLQAARESLHQAEARQTQARLRPNPSIDVSKTTDRIFANEGDTAFSVAFSQPFELGGKRAKRVHVEQASIEVSKAEIQDAERQLVGRLRTLYVEAVGAAYRLDLFERLDRLNQQMTSVMDVRLRSGDASQLDSRLLVAQTNQVRAQQLVARNQIAGVVLQIRTLVGLSPTEPLKLRRPEAAPRLAETEEAVVLRALGTRPDLKAARLREELAEAGIVLAKSQKVPNVTSFVRYGRESIPVLTAGGLPRSFERESVLEFGVSIPLPFFNREQGNIGVAASERVKVRAEREAMEMAVRREVVLAFRRYETARATLQILRTGVVEPNQESFQIVQLAYRLGEVRLLDIVNQQRIVIEAETSYFDAETELRAAQADLEAAIGVGVGPQD